MVSSNSRFQRRIAGHRLFVEQLLDPVFELIGLFFAHILDPRAVVAERRVAHRRVQQVVVDAVELEREEQQVQRGSGDAFLHVAVELGADRIGRIAGVEKRGIGDEPAEPVVDRLVLFDRFGQCASGALARRERGESPLEALLEGFAVAIALFEVGLDLRAVQTGIEIGQVPFGQFSEFQWFFRLSPRRGL